VAQALYPCSLSSGSEKELTGLYTLIYGIGRATFSLSLDFDFTEKQLSKVAWLTG
jgi:hypothetical protein